MKLKDLDEKTLNDSLANLINKYLKELEKLDLKLNNETDTKIKNNLNKERRKIKWKLDNTVALAERVISKKAV